MVNNKWLRVTNFGFLMQICGKYNHITNECWKLGSNVHKRPGFLGTITEEGDRAPIDGAEGTADRSEESNEDEQSEQSQEEELQKDY